MPEEDKKKTALITSDALFEFNVMTARPSNAPATFEGMINSVLRDVKWTKCLYYLDYIRVFSSTLEQHLEHLFQVLCCLPCLAFGDMYSLFVWWSILDYIKHTTVYYCFVWLGMQ